MAATTIQASQTSVGSERVPATGLSGLIRKRGKFCFVYLSDGVSGAWGTHRRFEIAFIAAWTELKRQRKMNKPNREGGNHE